MKPVAVNIRRLPHAEGLELPTYSTSGAAGMDFVAAVPETLVLAPGARKLIPTGFCIALPQGYELQVRPRSGLALKNGITVLNTPGTIDEDYRGEIGIILFNTSTEAFEITRGMRIAQGVLAPVVRAAWAQVEDLDATARGHGGFGSTGH